MSAPTVNGTVFASPDEVIFTGLVGTNQHLYSYNRASGEFRDFADRAGSYYALLPTRASRQLIFTHSGFTSPPDIYRMGWWWTASAERPFALLPNFGIGMLVVPVNRGDYQLYAIQEQIRWFREHPR